MSQEKGDLSRPSHLPPVLRGLTEPPGDPAALYEAGRDYLRAAAQLDDIDRDELRLLQQVHGPWEGAAEKGFLDQMRRRLAGFAGIAAGYRKAAGALKDYAAALENAQNAFRTARQLDSADHFRQMGLASHDPAYVFDLFSANRVRARSQVEAALERLRGANLRTTAVLKGLESTLGKRPPVKPDIYRSRGESMMQAGNEVKDSVNEDMAAICGTIDYVRPGHAKEAWNELWDDQIRRSTDPAGYVGDELYDFFNVEEFQADNISRGVAGVAYNVLVGWRLKPFRLINPENSHPKGERKKMEREEDDKSPCKPG